MSPSSSGLSCHKTALWQQWRIQEFWKSGGRQKTVCRPSH